MEGGARRITVEYLKSVDIFQREKVLQGPYMLADFHEHASVVTAHLLEPHGRTKVDLMMGGDRGYRVHPNRCDCLNQYLRQELLVLGTLSVYF